MNELRRRNAVPGGTWLPKIGCIRATELEAQMAGKKKAKKSKRGRTQDRARVAGSQDYEVSYAAEKTGRTRKAVKKAIRRVGNSRKRVAKALTGRKAKKR